ncbi:DUF5076 domain-containing protein [Granulicella cerasi]|uniref:DUF5076 domain-containing protein n=1 Tax=Granulicella cerasi TaxID=741063 RepID=UPI0021E05CBF|nr:DUF5076 domain-containing protein [Granulicella cerasi]
MSTKSLNPPPAADRDSAAFELLRVWVAESGQHVSLRTGMWQDPAAWGVVLADLARHIVNAEALRDKNLDREDFLDRLVDGFDAEIDSPTDQAEGEIQ